jgi:hypothetical protein
VLLFSPGATRWNRGRHTSQPVSRKTAGTREDPHARPVRSMAREGVLFLDILACRLWGMYFLINYVAERFGMFLCVRAKKDVILLDRRASYGRLLRLSH